MKRKNLKAIKNYLGNGQSVQIEFEGHYNKSNVLKLIASLKQEGVEVSHMQYSSLTAHTVMSAVDKAAQEGKVLIIEAMDKFGEEFGHLSGLIDTRKEVNVFEYGEIKAAPGFALIMVGDFDYENVKHLGQVYCFRDRLVRFKLKGSKPCSYNEVVGNC